MNAHNDFGRPESVTIRPFTGPPLREGNLIVSLPAGSVLTLEGK
jgi:hypothetical protein